MTFTNPQSRFSPGAIGSLPDTTPLAAAPFGKRAFNTIKENA